ncbi:MAG TPA: hypothetical protein VNG51_00650 [Ktedonobacteraceae bacterium]|nr:hypothetical protein [Ktedonobacteraceae bacterium]
MTTRLEEEICSQPEIIAHLLERGTRHVAQIVAHLPRFHYVLIAARGSSDYATYAWAALAGYPVALATPSLYTLYHTSPPPKPIPPNWQPWRSSPPRGVALPMVISNSPQALSLATSMPEWLTPIASIIPGQLLAMNLALIKGGNPDVPRGLHKVTRTL